MSALIRDAEGDPSGFVIKTDRLGTTYAPGTITIHHEQEKEERVCITVEDGTMTIWAYDLAYPNTPATITIDAAGGMDVST